MVNNGKVHLRTQMQKKIYRRIMKKKMFTYNIQNQLVTGSVNIFFLPKKTKSTNPRNTKIQKMQNKLHSFTGWRGDVHSPTRLRSTNPMNTNTRYTNSRNTNARNTNPRNTKQSSLGHWSGRCSLANTPAATVSVSQQKEECTARRLEFPRCRNTNTNSHTNTHKYQEQIQNRRRSAQPDGFSFQNAKLQIQIQIHMHIQIKTKYQDQILRRRLSQFHSRRRSAQPAGLNFPNAKIQIQMYIQIRLKY